MHTGSVVVNIKKSMKFSAAILVDDLLYYFRTNTS